VKEAVIPIKRCLSGAQAFRGVPVRAVPVSEVSYLRAEYFQDAPSFTKKSPMLSSVVELVVEVERLK
jgi:hypothetical protein